MCIVYLVHGSLHCVCSVTWKHACMAAYRCSTHSWPYCLLIKLPKRNMWQCRRFNASGGTQQKQQPMLCTDPGTRTIRASLTKSAQWGPLTPALTHVVVHRTGERHGLTTAHTTGYSNTAEAFVALWVCCLISAGFSFISRGSLLFRSVVMGKQLCSVHASSSPALHQCTTSALCCPTCTLHDAR